MSTYFPCFSSLSETGNNLECSFVRLIMAGFCRPRDPQRSARLIMLAVTNTSSVSQSSSVKSHKITTFICERDTKPALFSARVTETLRDTDDRQTLRVNSHDLKDIKHTWRHTHTHTSQHLVLKLNVSQTVSEGHWETRGDIEPLLQPITGHHSTLTGSAEEGAGLITGSELLSLEKSASSSLMGFQSVLRLYSEAQTQFRRSDEDQNWASQGHKRSV